jgi:hypothetical protein
VQTLGISLGLEGCPTGSGPLQASLALTELEARRPSVTAGVFFGWRRNRQDPEQRPVFFVVRIQEPGPYRAEPKLEVGLDSYEEARPPRAASYSTNSCFPPGKGSITLPAVSGHRWRRLRVKAVDDFIEISVDGRALPGFAVSQLILPAGVQRSEISSLGALGLLVERGDVCIQEAFVTALPSHAK